MFMGRTDAEAPNVGHLVRRADILEKTPCWERLEAGGEGDNRDDWRASLTQCTRVWANLVKDWEAWMLRFTGLHRVRHR